MTIKEILLIVALVLLVSGSVGLGFILGQQSIYRKLRTRTKEWLG
jgi:hypothetical protein